MRKTLDSLYQGLANGMASAADADAAGAGAAFYNYVDIEIRYTSEAE